MMQCLVHFEGKFSDIVSTHGPNVLYQNTAYGGWKDLNRRKILLSLLSFFLTFYIKNEPWSRKNAFTSFMSAHPQVFASAFISLSSENAFGKWMNDTFFLPVGTSLTKNNCNKKIRGKRKAFSVTKLDWSAFLNDI